MRKMFLLAAVLPALALAIGDMKWFDLNHWRAPFYNDGRWGIDVTVGSGEPGGSWPAPAHNCYVFGAGPWLAALAGTSSAETLCTVLYNPNSGGTEAFPTLCRYWRQGGEDSLDRIYKYPGDWPPPLSRFPMAPQVPRSDMDLWCGFCDSNPACHVSPGRPLGVDVYATVQGFSDSLAQDFFYMRYDLANCSGDTLRDALFGMMLDADIGDATDDMTGLILDQLFYVGGETIRVTNTGFVYDYNNMENPGQVWDSGTPGCVAVMLLGAPESLGLTAFKKFTIDIDPVTDPTQYLTLAGYDYRTGEYHPYDTVDEAPADKRVLLATGPFDLAPDSAVTFWYAVIASPFGDSGQGPQGRDTSELALRCGRARDFFERLTGIAEEPPTPGNVEPVATIVRGVLMIGDRGPKTGDRATLVDISGRKLMALHAGANDVSRLAPGVYFVRDEGGWTKNESTTTMRKVILQK